MNVRAALVIPSIFVFCLSAFAHGEEETRSFTNLQHPIVAKPIPIRGKLRFDREQFPDNVRGKFASFDGDSFAVTVPPRQAATMTADDVLAQVVLPLMRGMGFGDRVEELRRPKEASRGITLPTPNLAALATETCREVARQERFQPVCNAMLEGRASAAAERVFQLAYGMSFVQFKADIERPRIQYVFAQAPRGIPIEHAGVIAQRLEGETVTTIHGLLFNRYQITNEPKLPAADAVERALQRLRTFNGISPKPARIDQKEPRVDLVLLPYGGVREANGDEVIALRHAYRTLLFANAASGPQGPGHYLSWLAWIDAASGALLQLAPQFHQVSAQGSSWRRDPNTPTQVRSFQVDAAGNNQYRLLRAGVFNRFDRLGDGVFDDDEVVIADSGNGSSATLANFNQSPVNDAANAVCASGNNNTYRQVNSYAHLHSYRETLMSAGTFPVFPELAATVWVDRPDPQGNNALYDAFGTGKSRLNFVPGDAFNNAACPDVAGGILAGTTDPTSMTHEFAHLSTARMTDRRPADWCGMAPCGIPLPEAHYIFHDFADAFAQAYASTPCQAGWSRKNTGGIDAAENCASHNEGGGLPRLSSVGEPFSTASVQDHFPEKRPNNPVMTAGYADGQIAVTALWLTRQGMRSKCLPSGTPQYWVRLNRALYEFGFIAQTCTACDPNIDFSCSACDRDVYRFGQDMLREMAQQWATAGLPGGPPGFAHNGRHTTNKLLSAWARVGMFLLPFSCIDGDNATTDPTFCPAGEMGGDAIVDVFDNEPADDNVIDGITHPEFDYAKRGGKLPTFRVWTGPRYKFNAAGVARSYTPSAMTPSPCHAQFQVELASNDTFSSNLVVSGWQNVSTTAQPECYGTWQPAAQDWTTLSGASGDVKVYYRVRTHDGGGMNELLSTLPGSGSYDVLPPYVIVNDAGQP